MKIPKIRIPKIKNPLGIIDMISTVAGIACIFYGIYQVYHPAAWIILGAILSFPGIPRKEVK